MEQPQPRNRLWIFVAAFTGACHGEVERFQLPPIATAPPTEQIWRLTYNVGDDRAPVWSPDGDSILYSAASFGSFPENEGLLLHVPYRRGTARMSMPEIQTSRDAWHISNIAIAPDGSRTAHIEPISRRTIEEDCWGMFGVPDPDWPTPLTREIRVYVREAGSTAPREGVPWTGRTVPGLTGNCGIGFILHYFPFHRVVDQDGVYVFRPSWSPNGERVVFSDGTSLLLWEDDDESAPIPGTEDGVSPAWSPDGEWIAYTALLADDPEAPAATGFATYYRYALDRPALRLTSPDGAEHVDLGDGYDPAWRPDGSTLYYALDDQLWSYDLATGESEPLPGTGGGREPAVSPDGRHLAFSRRDHTGQSDIWVMRLVE